MQKQLFEKGGFTITRVDPAEYDGAQVWLILKDTDAMYTAECFYTDPRELTQLLAHMSLAVMKEFRPAPPGPR